MQQSIPFFISSTEDNSTNSGSTVRYHISPPLEVGRGKATFAIHNAEIFYTFPNISAALKTNFIIWVYPPVGPETYTFADGLYNLASINSNLRERFINTGFPEDLFIFTADASTGKVSIEFGYEGVAVSFSDDNSIGSILGWPNPNSANSTTLVKVVEAPDPATLNNVNRVLLHASFCSGGYLGGRGGSDTVASIKINAQPGRQIQYEPNNLIHVDVFQNHISFVEFYITDENGVYLNTNGEFWSATGVLTMYPYVEG